MKKIFSIFALAIFTAVAFTACNDDDNEWVDPNGDPLKVISNDTQFQAAASTGSVVVDTQDPVTVTSNDNGWVTTTVNGNTIEVAVTENPELDGRVATLTIKAGSKKTDVSIVQAGAIFQINVPGIYENNSAKTVTVPVKANLPVTINPVGDFFTATYDEENGNLIVVLTNNATGHLREGYIEYTCGNASGEIPVKQCVFATDLVGDYRFLYTNPSNGNRYYVNAKITGTQSNCKLEIPADEVVIPLIYSASDFSFDIKAGQEVGTFTYQGADYILGTIIWDTTAGYLTWVTDYGLKGDIQNGFLSDGSQVTLVTFADDGAWGDYTANALRIELFRQTPLNGNNRANLSLRNMVNPQLLREDVPAPSTDAATSIKSMKMSAMNASLASPAVALPVDNINISY